ncbi:MAG TPA: 2-amino-4-hydroxy-6-hydroxymethyldihydropteridine diphosphokinase [Anaerolineae bacterium]|nr:2-amino-4-hydroxy-6-hydroxymethyldihydropteridine diphosphokinase [Anaerolineae bacterium]HNU04613.1 2-amino-4-hydroxy-6-hydroxymethyldihydropteridine diphosphokinase [Anaerolineae bacterium]
MPVAYLSLGSNLDKEHNLPQAVRLLAGHGRLLAVSAVYETAPVGNPGDPTFFNAAVALETALAPAELKEQVLAGIEGQLGRQRSADPNAPRTIDIDISLYDQAILDLGRRHIPDPEILRFAHVAAPLADLAPDYCHPETGETLAHIAQRVTRAAPQPPRRRDDVALPCPPAG